MPESEALVRVGNLIRALARCYGAVLWALAALACLLLLALIGLVCADVALRVVNRSGVTWANEGSEYILYLMTFLSAPYLMRKGYHVRVDLLLRALRPRAAWVMEWIVDISGIVISCVFLMSAYRAVHASFAEGSLILKEFRFPEWWLLAPVPVCMLLLTLEFVFRLHRLATGERKMRDEATSAA
jgi:TRAP-type transport system small permease protein